MDLKNKSLKSKIIEIAKSNFSYFCVCISCMVLILISLFEIRDINRNDPVIAINAKVIERNAFPSSNGHACFSLDLLLSNNNQIELDCNYDDYIKAKYEKTVTVEIRQSFANGDTDVLNETNDNLLIEFVWITILIVILLIANFQRYF